ncbi:2-polyprenyl-6-methoxyphenol hydroxylase-like FAD-dependent oxidoreductase [Actinocorallia herbida]|uniref:2-polyprenyl-6-methoxyphenol hydroxylase-like FAD-dependent oxidoreductase n=1 Tax=Actinocorallia herbida TaxID=58109 RepID=A0A3N1CXQ7_9ACTN|nr:FAD-dependent monooxygenase [Actinocorallia herbida]ROO86082.1 2-polyprenyl-6-methoxyphenol hydroxylase-like FAD-dependent oxidoreductase [Actinocorallia herbida]
MSDQVVVVGGGPVGLWLAAELELGGVRAVVVEERAERDERSRALTVHPRTLEVLASRGAHGPFVAEGVPLPGGHFGVLEGRLDFRGLDSPFPYTLALPQARTEELLEAHARAVGARVLRGHRVTGLTEHPGSVTVHVDGPEGALDLEAAYVVGCDGARSTVRQAAGIEYRGTPSTVLGWLGDVVLDRPPAPGYSHFGGRGTLMAVPMPGGLHRLVGITPDDVTTAWPGDLTLDELRAKTVSLAGDDFGMRDPVWLSRYGNATRLAETYRKGRVLLAGDAAHQHFPAGGVGMNVGIQDAANLGWKLAATLRGAPEGLLDTYHVERHPVGAALTEGSRAQVALMTAFTPEGLSLRALLSGMITGLPAVNDQLAARVSALDVAYPPADPDAHPLTGTRAPDTAVPGTGLFALLRADAHLLLDLTGESAADLDRLRTPRLAVHSAAPDRAPASWAGVEAALIRPDGHVDWATDHASPARLAVAADALNLSLH